MLRHPALWRIAIGSAALWAAWGGPATAASAVPVPPEARAAIERANSEWADAIKLGDVERLTDPYAEDGVFVAADGTSMKGRKAIRDFFASGDRTTKVTNAELRSDGAVLAADGLVYEWGHGRLGFRTGDGSSVNRQATYVTVWKRLVNGEWRILRNLSF